MAHSKSDNSVAEKIELTSPTFYKVIMHNDNTTPMDLVVYVLNQIFHKSVNESFKLTEEAHNSGSAVVGVYLKDKAYTLKEAAMTFATQYGYGEFTLTIEEVK